MLGWTNDLPSWMESRKFVWGVLTFLTIVALATIGTVCAWLLDIPTDLFQQAMYLVTGGGATGVTTQAIVDREHAKGTVTNKTVTILDTPTARRASAPPREEAQRPIVPQHQEAPTPKSIPEPNSLFGG